VLLDTKLELGIEKLPEIKALPKTFEVIKVFWSLLLIVLSLNYSDKFGT